MRTCVCGVERGVEGTPSAPVLLSVHHSGECQARASGTCSLRFNYRICPCLEASPCHCLPEIACVCVCIFMHVSACITIECTHFLCTAAGQEGRGAVFVCVLKLSNILAITHSGHLGFWYCRCVFFFFRKLLTILVSSSVELLLPSL